MVKNVKGNLLDSDCDYICHQVNCKGVMRSGIAKQIRERFPEVYEEYKKLCESYECGPHYLLGSIQFVDRFGVINMFSQELYGYDGQRYTSYDAFAKCLHAIRARVLIGSKIGFPKNIGCGLGGGNWKIISALIEEILGKDYDVYIYELEGE